MIWVDDFTTKLVAFVSPKVTPVTSSEKPLPVIVTVSPPAVDTLAGTMPVTPGAYRIVDSEAGPATPSWISMSVTATVFMEAGAVTLTWVASTQATTAVVSPTRAVTFSAANSFADSPTVPPDTVTGTTEPPLGFAPTNDSNVAVSGAR